MTPFRLSIPVIQYFFVFKICKFFGVMFFEKSETKMTNVINSKNLKFVHFGFVIFR